MHSQHNNQWQESFFRRDMIACLTLFALLFLFVPSNKVARHNLATTANITQSVSTAEGMSSLLTEIDVVVETTDSLVVTEDTVAPAEIVDTAAPTEAVDTAALAEAVDTAAPTEAVDTAAPTVAVDTAAPTVAVDTAAPTVAVDTAAPTEAVDTAAPTEAVDTAAPTEAVDTATPAEIVDTATPAEIVDTAAPAEAVNTTVVTETAETLLDTAEVNISSSVTVSMKTPAGPVAPTHFMSLPLGTIPSVAAAATPFLKELQQTLRASEGSNGGGATAEERDAYVAALTQPVPKLHFTLLMLSLPTPALVAEAVALMPRVEALVREYFPDPQRTPLVLGGLQVMNNDPSASNVMYVELDAATEGGRQLALLVEKIGLLYFEAGLANPSDVARASRIHCTVCNTNWAVKRKLAPAGHTFDARPALAKFGNITLGSHVPVTVELNQLRGPRTTYYAAEAKVNFPVAVAAPRSWWWSFLFGK